MRICLDLETTGFDPSDDEILQIAICDWNGRALMSTYVRPQRKAEWPLAQRVNGIDPEDVAGYPAFADIRDDVQGIVDAASSVAIYNASFDSAFLAAAGVDLSGTDVVDTMREFARIRGEWSEKRGDYRWHKLADAVEHVGFEGHRAHDALGDAVATVAVQRWCDERTA